MRQGLECMCKPLEYYILPIRSWYFEKHQVNQGIQQHHASGNFMYAEIAEILNYNMLKILGDSRVCGLLDQYDRWTYDGDPEPLLSTLFPEHNNGQQEIKREFSRVRW